MLRRKISTNAGRLDDSLLRYLQETIRRESSPKHGLHQAFVPLLMGLMLIFPWPELGLSVGGANQRGVGNAATVPTYTSSGFQRAIAQR